MGKRLWTIFNSAFNLNFNSTRRVRIQSNSTVNALGDELSVRLESYQFPLIAFLSIGLSPIIYIIGDKAVEIRNTMNFFNVLLPSFVN